MGNREKQCWLEWNAHTRREQKDIKRNLAKTALPWLVLALVLPFMPAVLFTAKPVEAGIKFNPVQSKVWWDLFLPQGLDGRNHPCPCLY